MNRTNILALADVIERGFPDLQFDMRTMYDGKAGCLVGHFHRMTWGENAPAIESEQQQDAAIGGLARFLGLEADRRLKLLIAARDATPWEAATTLRTLANSGAPYWWPKELKAPPPQLLPAPLVTN